MIINLKQLQSMCKRVSLAIENNSVSVESGLINVSVKDGKLTLTVVDGDKSSCTYNVKLSCNVDTLEQMNATIESKLFLSLVARLSGEIVDLTIVSEALGHKLVIKSGDNSYTLRIAADSSTGESIQLADIELKNIIQSTTIVSDEVNSILDLSVALDNDDNFGIATAFLADDSKVLAASSQGVCLCKKNKLRGSRLLLTKTIAKLFKLFDNNITLDYCEAKDTINGDLDVYEICLASNDTKITAILPLEESALLKSYREEAIMQYVNMPQNISVRVDRLSIIDALKRLQLFSTKLNPFIQLDFDENALKLSVPGAGVNETVEYVDSDVDTVYQAYVDINTFLNYLSNLTSNQVEVSAGNRRAITLSNEDTTFIVLEAHEG